jgi:hypothetical protein
MIYTVPGETITAFDFVTLKPIGKSPSGFLVSQAVAIALENGVVKVYDTFLEQTLLFELVVGKDIQEIASSTLQDDMSVSVLTSDGHVHIYEIKMERKVSTGSRERHLPNEGKISESEDSIHTLKS